VTRRKLTAFAFGTLVVTSLAMTVAVLIAPSAAAARSAASRYGVINATVNAATVHEVAGSSAFPNFTTGAVDNYYSMAHSQVDNSPFAEGTASPADTGPIGQTIAAGHFQQPQYADARWPGQNSGKASAGKSGGGPYAVADATSYNATAQCSEASGSNGSSSPSLPGLAAPKGFSRRLHVALAAWKGKWLVPLHLKVPRTPPKPKVPAPVPTPTVPTPTVSTPTVTVPPVPKPSFVSESSSKQSSSGSGGVLLESSTLATLDPGSGDLVTKGESSLGRVSLGNGQILIRGIDVSVSVENNGKPTGKTAVDVGATSIGGVPVTIDQDGVHVQGHGSKLPYAQADNALNAALKKAGVELHTATPEVDKAPNEETITATGVHVAFAQPVDAAGVPAQYVDHIVGEVFVDSLAAPAGPIPKLSLGLAGGAGSALGGTSLGGSSGSTGFPSGGGSSSSYSSQPTSSGGVAQAAPASSLLGPLTNKPAWLLVGYLVWQTLVIGTGLSLRQWWMGGAS
jgi:hypothetical protein